MPAPNTPTTFLAQAGDGKVALTFDQMATATSYLIERSIDGITFVSLATVSGSPLQNFYVDSNLINAFATQINVTSANVFIIGQPYVITSLGTTTQSQWNTLGVPSTTVPSVGLIFNAAITGAGSGTGTVQYGLKTGQQYFYQVAAENGSGTSLYTIAQGVIPCLPGQECLGNLRLYAKQRADRVGSNFVTTAEWNQMITKSYKELYDIIIQKFGDDYYYTFTPYAFLTSGSTQIYALPDGVTTVSSLATNQTPSPAFYKLLLCEVALNPNDPNSWVTLRQYERIQQNLWNYPNIYTFRGVTNLRYRLTGNGMQLVPQTQAGQTVRLWYAPRPSVLMLDTDIIDGISGWEDYVIVDAAIKALTKEESPTQELTAMKMALLKRIEEAAENRNIGEPETVSDSKMRNLAWTDDSGYGSGSGFY